MSMNTRTRYSLFGSGVTVGLWCKIIVPLRTIRDPEDMLDT
jgi:hypothetical protein